MSPQETLFDGKTFSEATDNRRLKSEYERITELCKDGQWRTLRRIHDATGIPEASAQARLRDHRKPKFNSPYDMESKRSPVASVWLYRLVTR